MTKRRYYYLAVTLAMAGCSEPGPSIAVSSTQIVAPAPGRAASVAYMTISNSSDDTVSIRKIEGPQFERIELHETVLDDGIARMQPLRTSIIAPGGEFSFKPGGPHIMLLEPTSGIVPGKIVTLHVHFSSGEIVIVQAPVSTRVSIVKDN